MFDLQVPFFRPLWIRVVVTAVTMGWALVETAAGNMIWAAVFGAMGVYAFYHFFIVFSPRKSDDREGGV